MANEADIERLKASKPGRQLVKLDVADEDGTTVAEVVAMIPGRTEIQVFRDMQGKPELKSKAAEIFVRNCTLDPAGEEFTNLIERKPLIVTKLGDELMKLAGSEDKVTVKKL